MKHAIAQVIKNFEDVSKNDRIAIYEYIRTLSDIDMSIISRLESVLSIEEIDSFLECFIDVLQTSDLVEVIIDN